MTFYSIPTRQLSWLTCSFLNDLFYFERPATSDVKSNLLLYVGEICVLCHSLVFIDFFYSPISDAIGFLTRKFDRQQNEVLAPDSFLDSNLAGGLPPPPPWPRNWSLYHPRYTCQSNEQRVHPPKSRYHRAVGWLGVQQRLRPLRGQWCLRGKGTRVH